MPSIMRRRSGVYVDMRGNRSTDGSYFTASAHLQDNRIERALRRPIEDKTRLRIECSLMTGTFQPTAGALKVN